MGTRVGVKGGGEFIDLFGGNLRKPSVIMLRDDVMGCCGFRYAPLCRRYAFFRGILPDVPPQVNVTPIRWLHELARLLLSAPQSIQPPWPVTVTARSPRRPRSRRTQPESDAYWRRAAST